MTRAGAALILLLGAIPAHAQSDNRRWEFDFHVGGLTGTDPISGSGRLPDPLPSVPTLIPLPTGARSTPVVTSWFFGEGATLMNVLGAYLVRVPIEFSPLDPVLTRGDVRNGAGTSAGVRIGERFGEHWRGELSVAYGSSGLEIGEEALEQLEASRSTFADVFGRSLVFLGVASASANVSVRHHDSGVIVTMVSVSRDLPRVKALLPYLRGGVGVTSTIGEPPSLQLAGEYTIRNALSSLVVTQRDVVSVAFRQSDQAFTWAAGGGARIDLTSRWLVRLDASVVVSRPEFQIALSTASASDPAPFPGGSATLLGTIPAIVFSTTTAVPSTLSGPALHEFVTLSNVATHTRFNITAGVGFRF